MEKETFSNAKLLSLDRPGLIGVRPSQLAFFCFHLSTSSPHFRGDLLRPSRGAMNRHKVIGKAKPTTKPISP
jgi:hypothetical protein